MFRTQRCMFGVLYLASAGALAASSASAQTTTQIIDTTGSGTPGETLVQPMGITTDAVGNVYIAAGSTNNAFKITPVGVISQIIDAAGSGVPGETLAGSNGIAVDPAGNVYVSGRLSHNVFRIEPGGTITRIIDSTGDGGGNALTTPWGVVLGADGNVYVCGEFSHNAFKIEPDGTITEIIDATGDGTNALTAPMGIAADASGNVYVSGSLSNNVFKIEPVGTITQIIDSSAVGPGTLQAPTDITVDADGNVYLVGQNSDNAFKIEPGGAITQIITSSGGGGGTLVTPNAITIDAWGNVFVAGYWSDNVFRIRPDGSIFEILDATGDGLGHFFGQAFPSSIAVDDSGTIYASGVQTDNAFRIEPRFYVDVNASGAKDGTSWVDAYADLQAALVAAANTGKVWQVWVADGTYLPADCGPGGCILSSPERVESFNLRNDMAIYGSFDGAPGGETQLSERDLTQVDSILLGDLNVDDVPVPCAQDSPTCDSLGGRCLDGSCAVRQAIGENSYHVVRADLVDDTAILDGFVVMGGNANGVNPEDDGGGLYVTNSSPVIRNCTIRNNRAMDFTGGAFNLASTPTYTNCTIEDNVALFGPGISNESLGGTFTDCLIRRNLGNANGGGMLNWNGASPTVTRCVFDDNTAEYGANARSEFGSPVFTDCTFRNGTAGILAGGASNFNTNATYARCTFTNNHSNRSGAAFEAFGGVVTVVDSTFRGNTADWFAGVGYISDESTVTFTNVDFDQNTAGEDAGALHIFSGSLVTITNGRVYGHTASNLGTNSIAPRGGGAFFVQDASELGTRLTLVNCSVVQNRALGLVGGGQGFGGAIAAASGSVVVKNSLIWGNTAPVAATLEEEQIWLQPGFTAGTFDHSTIEGWTGGFGGIGNNGGLPGDDPLFVDAVLGDLHLSAGSPAIDFADNTALPDDLYDLDGDAITAGEKIPLDVAGLPRFLDDPLIVDQGVGGPPGRRIDRGCHEYFADCDATGIPEACDLNCTALENLCSTYAGCGAALDCNTNARPDACDINECATVDATCVGNVPCDDCNLNSDLDGCVPPANCECWIPSPVTQNWSEGGNWVGGVAPVNAGASTFSVTIADPTADVLVDTNITVDTARILLGATLNVSGETVGDLTLAEPGGLLNEGHVLVAYDRQIDASAGEVVIGPDGVYEKDAAAAGTASASLLAGDLTIEAGSLLDLTFGGRLTLSDDMSLAVSGDLTMIGPSGIGAISRTEAPYGITPSPKLDLRNGGAVVIAGGLKMVGAAEITLDGSGAQVPPGAHLTLQGDFVNGSTDSTLFDMSSGHVTLGGADPQTFEVAGVDYAASPLGFGTVADRNFSIDMLEVAPGASISFVNRIANTSAVGLCSEVLYVRELTLGAASTVTLDNTVVYWETLVDLGATVEPGDCGGLTQICPKAAAPIVEPTGSIKNRFISFNDGNAGLQTAIRVQMTNLPAPFHTWNGTTTWVQKPEGVSELGGVTDSTPPTFNAATLGCTPYYTNWNDLGTVHVYHEGIVPDGVYTLQAIESTCNMTFEPSFSLPLILSNARWGDVAGPFDPQAGAYSPADGVVSVPVDTVALVDKFRSLPGAPIKARADIDPAVPNMVINITDITRSIDAFRGAAYPFSPAAGPPCS